MFSREPLKNPQKEQKHQIEELHHLSIITQLYGSIDGESLYRDIMCSYYLPVHYKGNILHLSGMLVILGLL